MSINLLELLKEHLSGDVISNLASLVGESHASTESALKAAIPSVLSGLIKQSNDSETIGNLFNVLTSGDHDGGVLSNLGALSRGGDESNQVLTQGGQLMAFLFGDNASNIADLISNNSGISKASSATLLNFITPISMGLIGKLVTVEKIDSASALGDMLGGQGQILSLGSMLPAGMDGLLVKVGTGIGMTSKVMDTIEKAADSFGLDEAKDFVIDKANEVSEKIEKFGDTLEEAADSLGLDEAKDFVIDKASEVSEKFEKFGDTIEDMAEETLSSAKEMASDFGDTASKFGSHVIEETKELGQNAADVMHEAEKKGGKFLPWLLILAALALLWGLLKSCSSEPQEPINQTTAPEATPPTAAAPSATPATPAEPEATAPSAPAAVPAQAAPEPEPAKTEPAKQEARAHTQPTEETAVPKSNELEAANDSNVSKLIAFIESPEPVSDDRWFAMNNIQFDTGKASIRAVSNAQIGHIAEVLKAFPKVNIKVGGYADNTGNAAANKVLSDNRAKAVKKALVAKGIKADRIAAEGYGSDHPVASNDTSEGRQQNRRIDVRVSEK